MLTQPPKWASRIVNWLDGTYKEKKVQNSIGIGIGGGGGGGINDYWTQQQMQNQAYHSGITSASRPTQPRKPSWNVQIETVENGFLVTVYDVAQDFGRKFIATDMNEVADQLKVGIVLGKLET